MNIDLNILHLRRALCYAPIEKPAHTDEAALEEFASQFGECILLFEESKFSTMTEDGPKLLGAPAAAPLPIESAFRAVANDEPVAFSLAAGDYVFFQWRARSEREEAGTPLGFAAMLEEVVRETWWQRLECDGPWYVRLVAEDGNTAIQALRKLHEAP